MLAPVLQVQRVAPAAPATPPALRLVEPPVRISAYDGPLDLLLFLVRKEGVALREIPVARICDAYLAHLGGLDEIDVDRAGDYLAMASTLCLLKARELLPKAARPELEEEEEDPKDALERRLLEYERFRDAAEELGRRQLLNRDVFTRPPTVIEADEQPVDPTTDALGLARIFYELLEKRAAPPAEHRVVTEHYTLAERVSFVLSRLDDGQEHQLSEFWTDMPFRRARVITFLAVLEAARLQMLDVWQRMHLGAVTLVGKVRSEEADLSLLAGEETTPTPSSEAP